MICFLISIILFILKATGVIHISDWLVSLPMLCVAATSSWLFMKAEVEYLKSIRKNKKEEQPAE